MKLIIVRGPSGSGKSTLAEKLSKEFDAVVVEADMFFVSAVDGQYRYNHDNIKQAHAYCQSLMQKALADGRNVIVSNTSIKCFHVEGLIKVANEVCRPEVIVYRTLGTFDNVHQVPEDTVNWMRANIQDYPGEVLHQPY
ncbi:ATP-binding protein [Vibrio mediterranei]|uniref:ATP-binding protein n=1 Tax=Vibrio mediterranei TaxID=689 RepID=UPI00406934B4